jgi:hypothetical protein
MIGLADVTYETVIIIKSTERTENLNIKELLGWTEFLMMAINFLPAESMHHQTSGRPKIK